MSLNRSFNSSHIKAECKTGYTVVNDIGVYRISKFRKHKELVMSIMSKNLWTYKRTFLDGILDTITISGGIAFKPLPVYSLKRILVFGYKSSTSDNRPYYEVIL